MERRKMTKEDIDKVRDIEGLPIGKNGTIEVQKSQKDNQPQMR